MKLKLSAYFKRKHKLAYYLVTIAGWCALAIGSTKAYANPGKSQYPQFDFDSSTPTTLLLTAAASLDVESTAVSELDLDDEITVSQSEWGDRDDLKVIVKISPAVDRDEEITLAQPSNKANQKVTTKLVPAVDRADTKKAKDAKKKGGTKIAQTTIINTPNIQVPGNLPPTINPNNTQINPLNPSNAPSPILDRIDSTPGTQLLEPLPDKFLPPTGEQKIIEPTQKDTRFIIAPQVLDPREVDPFSTQFVLNGNRVSHFTNTVANTIYDGGNFRFGNLNFDIYRLVNGKNTQSITNDRVLRVNTQLEVSGVRTVAQNQDINVIVAQPQTLLGVRQQISLDGSCLDSSGRICSFLPGITIDERVIDKRKLQPTGTVTTSAFGDVISPQSQALIRQPNAFSGGETSRTSPKYGLDLLFPAVGVVENQGPPPPLTGRREEDIKPGYAVNFAKFSQDFATNGEESTIARTVRGWNFVNGDRNQLTNLGLLALGQVLPDATTSIKPGKPGAQIVVNPNLFRAANAVRVPDNSLTVYQSGTGYAPSVGNDPKVPPGASHNALWLGMSPVIDRQFLRDFFYVTLRDPRVVSQTGGEGGNVPVDVTLDNIRFTSAAIQSVYAQAYVSVLNTDVDRNDVDTIRQRTDYYPHLSFTGTSMTENSIWRYYTGALFNVGFKPKTKTDIKSYVGSDFSVITPSGLTASFGGIGYLNPDPEYYSQVFASASQTIGLGKDSKRNNIVLGVNGTYVLNGAINIQGLPVRTSQSSLNANVTANFDRFSLGATRYFGSVLPDSIEAKLLINGGWRVADNLNIGAFFSAFDRNISRAPYGLNLNYILDPNSNSTLTAAWNTASIDFRRTLGPRGNIFRDNTFTLSIKHDF